MDVESRMSRLKALFSYEKKARVEESRLQMTPWRFTQTMGEGEIAGLQSGLATSGFCSLTDDRVPENHDFNYVVLSPENNGRPKDAILLLHGLNERSWDKYLPWAERLSVDTGKPVILFPIAFHMNRTPRTWADPRVLMPWLTDRKKRAGNPDNATFANLALSSRLSMQPQRFYTSGLETVYNVMQLVREIKEGRHPQFAENTSVNLFGYSIGALISQVLFLSDAGGLFADSRLFMFCGGSLMDYMDGNARDIMDKEAFDTVKNYYTSEFVHDGHASVTAGRCTPQQAFRMLILPDAMRGEREGFFSQAVSRIKAVSLKRDTVMPTAGIKAALGDAWTNILEELDFPFSYSHQKPFPLGDPDEKEQVNEAFSQVMQRACAFV